MAHPKHPLETSGEPQTGLQHAISQLTDSQAGYVCKTARLTVGDLETRIELFNGQLTPDIEITVFPSTGVTQICQWVAGKKICEVHSQGKLPRSSPLQGIVLSQPTLPGSSLE